MLAFSNDYYGMIFRATQSVELFCAYDKAKSLEKLLRYLDCSRKEMVACGDGLNDLTMIEYAGIGVAMDNAQPVLKEKSDFVTLSNDQDGVAEAVKHFWKEIA